MTVAVLGKNQTLFWNAVIEIMQLQILILITLQPHMGQKQQQGGSFVYEITRKMAKQKQCSKLSAL